MTIVDIARESGYSISTVSRVLNNRKDVSPEAERKIRQVVAAHNFIPNNNARHLKQTTSKTILVLVKGISNMLFADILEEIQRLMENTEYTVGVCHFDEYENEVKEAIRLCSERKPLGILFLGGNPQSFQEDYQYVTVPGVLVTNQGESLGYANLSSVATDDKEAAGKAVDFLLESGHRGILILGGDREISHTSRQRYLGCVESFAKHGKVLDSKRDYITAKFSFESACEAMGEALKSRTAITAVFAMSDVMAIGAIRAIRDAGLRVPEDISVMGFDGTLLGEYYNPKLATVRQKYRQMAKRSVEILLDMIESGSDAVHEVVPFTLSTGESVRTCGEEPV